MDEIPCGRIGMNPLSECAERAAMAIPGTGTPLAVCLSPHGHVTVEAPDQALTEDLVGVYSRDWGVVKLWTMIEADLVTAANERDIRGGSRQLQRVKGRTRRAA